MIFQNALTIYFKKWEVININNLLTEINMKSKTFD